jgi:hypothetical protein
MESLTQACRDGKRKEKYLPRQPRGSRTDNGSPAQLSAAPLLDMSTIAQRAALVLLQYYLDMITSLDLLGQHSFGLLTPIVSHAQANLPRFRAISHGRIVNQLMWELQGRQYSRLNAVDTYVSFV